MDNGIITMIVVVAIVLIIVFMVVLIKSVKKKQEEKYREAQKAERELQQKEKERQERVFVNKVKNNALVCGWAEEVASTIYAIITEKPYLDYNFNLRSYKQDFVFGRNLQSVWLENMRKVIDKEGFQSYKVYNFAKYGVPGLNTEEEITLFSRAMAEIIKEILIKKEIKIEIGKISTFVDVHNHEIRDLDKTYISTLSYIHPSAGASW